MLILVTTTTTIEMLILINTTREMRSVFNCLLAALSSADLLFCIANLAITPVALGRCPLCLHGDHLKDIGGHHKINILIVIILMALVLIITMIILMVRPDLMVPSLHATAEALSHISLSLRFYSFSIISIIVIIYIKIHSD